MKGLVDKILKRLPQGRLAKGAAVLAGGTAAGQFLNLAATPVLSRLYTPADFGVLAAFSATVSILGTITCLSFERAIPIADDDAHATSLIKLCTSITVGLTILVWLLGPFILPLIDAQKHGSWFAFLLPVSFLFLGIYQAFNYLAIRRQAFPTIAKTRLAQGVGQTIIQLGMGLLSLGSAGLLIGFSAGQGLGITALVRATNLSIKQLAEGGWFAGLKEVAKRYAKFPLLYAPAALVGAAGLQIPPLILTATYTAQVAGHYYMAQKLFGLPVQMIGVSTGQVFLSEAGRLYREEPMRIRIVFNRFLKKMLKLALVPTLILVLAGGFIFEFVLGHGWAESGLYLQILAAAFFTKFGMDSLIDLAIIERQDLALIWSVTRFIAVTASLLIPAAMHQPPLVAIICLSIALTGSYLFKYVLWLVGLRKLERAQPI